MRATLLLFLTGCEVLFPRTAEQPADALEDAGTCATAIGHDEDGDGIDDACDVCPAVPDNGEDADGDGVGDACDPLPDNNCEVRLKFEGFGAIPADLLLEGADWSIGGDDLIQASPSGIRLAHWPATMSFDDVTLRAELTITGSDAAAFNNTVEIGSGGETTGVEPSAGRGCQLHREEMKNTVVLVDENPDSVITSGTASGNLADTHTLELINGADGFLSCRLTGVRSSGMASTAGTNPKSMGELFVWADDVAVRVHWIDAIQNLCPR